MSYGFEFRKNSGQVSYTSGDSVLRFLGVVELVSAGFSQSFGPVTGSGGSFSVYSGHYNRNRLHFVEVLGPGLPGFTGAYSVSNALMFFRLPSGVQIMPGTCHVAGRIRTGFFITGSLPAGRVIRVYCFAPGRPTSVEASTGHGISVYDASGAPVYTSGFSDLSFQGMAIDRKASVHFSSRGGYGRKASFSYGFITGDSAFYVSGGGLDSTVYSSTYVRECVQDYQFFSIRPGVLDFYGGQIYLYDNWGNVKNQWTYVGWRYPDITRRFRYNLMTIDVSRYDSLGPTVIRRTMQVVNPAYE